MRNLVLTGFMATGKSTVGRILAERYGLRFVDLDDAIEAHSGRTVRELIDEGEGSFRDIEHKLLAHTLCHSGAVIATGGGALTFPRNCDLLDADDAVVSLTCSLQELLPRLGDRSARPLVAGLEAHQIAALMEGRRSQYERFLCIDTSRKTPDEVAAAVAQHVNAVSAARFSMQREAGSEVLFGNSLLDSVGEIMRARGMTGDVLVVSDERVAAAGHVDRVLESFAVSGTVHSVLLPPGEEHKTLRGMEPIYDACAAARLERSSVIVGVGGGVIGDMAGMAAATYVRGVRLVLVPTTLLAQVDAAIGGKVGIDFGRTKNMIGAFHPAEVVAVDPGALRTLPLDALRDGLAEIIKIALVRSLPLLESLEGLSTASDIVREPAIVRWAAVEKVRVVSEDPYERGVRALLNFGHTVGHGIEAASGYRLSHGQSVAIGMVAETSLAVRSGICTEDVMSRLMAFLDRMNLPMTASGLDADEVIGHILHDKKRLAGRIRFAVPASAGTGTTMEVDTEDVRRAVRVALGEEG